MRNRPETAALPGTRSAPVASLGASLGPGAFRGAPAVARRGRARA